MLTLLISDNIVSDTYSRMHNRNSYSMDNISIYTQLSKSTVITYLREEMPLDYIKRGICFIHSLYRIQTVARF
jgi:hypothetical protein